MKSSGFGRLVCMYMHREYVLTSHSAFSETWWIKKKVDRLIGYTLIHCTYVILVLGNCDGWKSLANKAVVD